jgi:putative motility protein YjfB-like
VDVTAAMLAQRSAATGQDASVALLRRALDLQEQQAQSLLQVLPGESIDPGLGGTVDRYA